MIHNHNNPTAMLSELRDELSKIADSIAGQDNPRPLIPTVLSFIFRNRYQECAATDLDTVSSRPPCTSKVSIIKRP